ncbi:hypothetical protein EVAR_70708_1 [Eumeta japonica]|uniref:Uncharacterized protein n=1 Tax=Eumeta variegata TaxID=151549 RepID=A0A4C2A4H5_EUMVA|nr:hypothetical protein EVAR_70708_1 [Eumeta japonica]
MRRAERTHPPPVIFQLRKVAVSPLPARHGSSNPEPQEPTIPMNSVQSSKDKSKQGRRQRPRRHLGCKYDRRPYANELMLCAAQQSAMRPTQMFPALRRFEFQYLL